MGKVVVGDTLIGCVLDPEAIVGTGTCPLSPAASLASASPSPSCSLLPPSLPLFNLVLKICCILGRLRYARSDLPNVNWSGATLSLFLGPAVRARGGNVAIFVRECRAG